MRAMFALAFVFSAVAAGGSEIAGNWHLTGSVAEVPIDRVCAIQQTGEKIQGPCKNQTGEVALTGDVKNSDITWKYLSTYQGVPVLLVFKGTLVSDREIKGTITASDPDGGNSTSGSFSAQRQ